MLAWRRLRSEERLAVRRVDMWLTAIDALVVLALGDRHVESEEARLDNDRIP